MAQNEVPKELVVPMDHIAEGVRGLRIAFVNVFEVIHAGGSWTLIKLARFAAEFERDARPEPLRTAS